MSLRWRRLLGALAIFALMAGPAQADLIPDPIEIGLLAEIKAALKAIHEWRLRILGRLQEKIDTRVNAYAFPAQLFKSIKRTISTVVDIRQEIQHLACEWPVSPRTFALRDLFLTHRSFCRNGYQAVWGSHERLWDGEVQEVGDYVGTMTANMLSERAEKTSTSWVGAFPGTFEGEAILQRSPGEANRIEAAALGWTNEVAVGNNQVLTQHLLVKQLGRSLDKFDQRKAADLSYYTYKGLATLAGPAPLPAATGARP